MSYFNQFPSMLYDPAGDGSAKVVTNIMKRVRVRANMKKEVVMLDTYAVKENETHHYEISQTSGDTTIKIEVENSTYPSATTITNYEYEIALNDSKREIDLLRNDYLAFFVDEFQNSI